MIIELVKDLAPLLTILGWGVVLYNTDRISLRNESRAAIDACIKKLEELIELTYEHIHDKSSEKKENSTDISELKNYRYEGKVASLLSIIDTKNSYLYKRTHKRFIDNDSLVQLRTKLASNSEELDEGIEISLDIIDSLEETFSQRFSRKWYHFVPYWLRITIVIAIWCVIYFGVGSFFIGLP
ncbi:hypothetical protein [Vibrio coralliilyticus]|uniref:hypothetical protein n=1 Tax=Vibrio coralliilyticus TaxID=190893 RepID=UPI00148CD829|nr:hypothetical protein [Vibrio coralliilyticus]NOI32178.1 hypothetical protein [Vibrio coralliilyticus]NOI51356.1 hypothetical protein [Vibrio coralliilyticus]